MSFYYTIHGLVTILMASVPLDLLNKAITDTARSASYLDLHIEIDSECRSRRKIYNVRFSIFPL